MSFDTSSATAMSLMFYVRSAARALPPHSPPAGPFACAACARRCRTRAPGLGIGRAPRALWSPLCPQPSSLSLCGPLCVRAACARAPAPHANPTPQLPRAFRPAHTHTSPGISHALLSTRQEAKAFNQRPWFDLSSAEDMGFMFTVRSAARICPASRTLQPRGSSAFAPLVLPRAARSPASVPRPPRTPRPAHIARSPFDLAGLLPVRRQQTAHPLRMGGHPGLRQRSTSLRRDLGSGKLPVRIGSACVHGETRCQPRGACVKPPNRILLLGRVCGG